MGKTTNSLPLGANDSINHSSKHSDSSSDAISLGKFLLVVLLLTSSLVYLVSINVNLRADINSLRENEQINSGLQNQYKSYNGFYNGQEKTARELQTSPTDGAVELPGLVSTTIFDQDNEINRMKKELEVLKGLVQAQGQTVSVDKAEVDVYSYINPNNGNATLSVKTVGSESQNVLIDTSSTTQSKSPNIILGGDTQKLGVGIKNPEAELHVNGVAKSNGVVVKDSATIQEMINTKTFSAGTLSNTNGFVGVGVNSPKEAFHVGGNAKVEGQLSSHDLNIKNNLRVLQSIDSGPAFVGKAALIGSVKIDPLDIDSNQVLIDKKGNMLVNKAKAGELSVPLEVGGMIKANDVLVQVTDVTQLGIVQINSAGNMSINDVPSSDYKLKIVGNFALKGDLNVVPDSIIQIGNVKIDQNSVGINTDASALNGLTVVGNVKTDDDIKVVGHVKSKVGGLEVNLQGKVGIGTAPGLHDVSVNGNIKVIGDFFNTPTTSNTTIGPITILPGSVSTPGKVGLSKSVPTKGLDINGDVLIQGDVILNVPSTTTSTSTSQSRVGSLYFNKNSNVGVDTAAPSKKLEVNGNLKGFSDIFVDTSATTIIGDLRVTPTKVGLSKDPVKDFDVEGKAHISEGVSVKVTSKKSTFISLRISEDGKVGINQAEPGTNRLEVTGDAYVVKDLFVRTLSTSKIGPINILNSGLVGMGKTPSSERLEIDGTMLGTKDIVAKGDTRSYIGQLIFLKEKVGIKTEPTMALDVLGDTATTGNIYSDMTNTDKSYIKPLYITKKDLYSRIGIGTSDPLSELHVIGSSYFEGNINVENYKRSQVGTTLFLDSGDYANHGVGGVGIISPLLGYALNVEGDMKVSKNTKIIGDATIGEVYSVKVGSSSRKIGVGFTGPTKELEVFGSAKLETGTFNLPVPSGDSYLGGINFGPKTGTNNGNIGINQVIDSNSLSVNGNVLVTESSTSLTATLGQFVINSGTNSMKIFASGKVAIGSTATEPVNSKLAVTGNIKFSGGTSVIVNGGMTANSFEYGQSASKVVTFSSASTSGNPTSVIQADGSVLIKKTTQTTGKVLDVNGKSTITGKIESNSANLNGFIIENGPGRNSIAGGPGSIKLFSDGKMTINTNSAKTEKLYVKGTIRSTGLNVPEATTISSVEFSKKTSGNPVRWDGKTLVVNSPNTQTDQDKIVQVLGGVEGDVFEVSRSTTHLNNFGGVKIRADEGYVSVGTESSFTSNDPTYFKATHASKLFNIVGNVKVEESSDLKLGKLTHSAATGVGIGVAGVSTHILKLSGNWKSSGDICVRGKCLNSWNYFTNNANTKFVGRDTSGTNNFYADGKIAIGSNTVPTDMLEISGSIKSISNSGSVISGFCSITSTTDYKCHQDFISAWEAPVSNVYRAKTQGKILFDGNGRFSINDDIANFDSDQAGLVAGNIKVSGDVTDSNSKKLNSLGFQETLGGYKMGDSTTGAGMFFTNDGKLSIGRTLPEYALHTKNKIISSIVQTTNGFSLADQSTFPLQVGSCGINGYEFITDSTNTIGIDERGLLFIGETATDSNQSPGLKVPANRDIILPTSADACVGSTCLSQISGSYFTDAGTDIRYNANFKIDKTTGLLNKVSKTVTDKLSAQHTYDYSYFDEWVTTRMYLQKATSTDSSGGDCYTIGEIKVNSASDILICLMTSGTDAAPIGVLRALVPVQ